MISLCMIVKNESKNIEKCINSVKKHMGEYVDDFVIVDTGSTDGTIDILNKLECRVYNFEWCSDFSKARNFSISKAKNDWILSLDADEYIEELDNNEIERFFKKNNEKCVGNVNIQNLDNNGVVYSGGVVIRIFNKKYFSFEGKVHEFAVPKKGVKQIDEFFNIIVRHTGYSEEVMTEKNKFEIYKKMTENELLKKPNDFQLMTHLASCYKGLGDLEKAIEYYEKVIFNDECVNAPYYPIAVTEYLKILIQLEQYSVAKVCENLWSICSKYDGYVYLMGYIYLELGELEKAIDCYLNCINRTGVGTVDKKLSYMILGDILEQLGDFEQALVCYKAVGTYDNAHLKVKEIEEKIKYN